MEGIFEEHETIEEKFSKLIDFTTSLLDRQKEEDDKWEKNLQSLRNEYLQQFEAQSQRAVTREQELTRLKEENEELRKKLDESKSYLEECKSLELLSEMAGLCVPERKELNSYQTDQPHVFLLTAGEFEGMKFSLTFDPLQEEYSYRVLQLSENVPKDSDFRHTFCFPQDMLQMFFCKLLRSHYNVSDKSL